MLRLRPSHWAARPVNPTTNRAKEMEITNPSCAEPVEPDAWRQACPCSTEAR
jgi:hypothetical protein